tara:strand:+ start:492 stop:671 length:180 start_codon:yes stop_codon:yes gene_type:complete
VDFFPAPFGFWFLGFGCDLVFDRPDYSATSVALLPTDNAHRMLVEDASLEAPVDDALTR